MTASIIADLESWRRSLLHFKSHAKRDGDWLLDWRPWNQGDRTHIASIDGVLRRVEWLLAECARRSGDKDFFAALDIMREGERLGAADDFDVYRPALKALTRQRHGLRKVNAGKALNETERARCVALCAEYWQHRKTPLKRGAKASMLRWVASKAKLSQRRVRDYLYKLPVPYTP